MGVRVYTKIQISFAIRVSINNQTRMPYGYISNYIPIQIFSSFGCSYRIKILEYVLTKFIPIFLYDHASYTSNKFSDFCQNESRNIFHILADSKIYNFSDQQYINVKIIFSSIYYNFCGYIL